MRYTLSFCALFLGLVADASFADDNQDHFERHIRPLLIQHCLECHSGRTPEGKLDLASQSGWEQGGMNGPLSDHAHWNQGTLWDRLTTQDKDRLMPPEKRLGEQDLAHLQKWLEQGAKWPQNDTFVMPVASSDTQSHWAFEPIQATSLPQVKNPDWCWNDVDRFVRHRMDQLAIEPVEDASPSVFLRRIYLDLTGMPPTTEQLAKWQTMEDPRHNQLIEHLLTSRAYAERQARRWLDLARYADTSGDGTDMPIPEARYYRDWVIEALEADMPYDQFLIEQIAGDVLADQQPENPEAYKKTIATGYLALSRRFGNSKFAEMHQIIDDSIDTIGRSVMGLSLGCARCHHHKFDPVTMEDYYGLYGYFASTQYPHAGTEHQKERSDMPEIKIPEQLSERMESNVAWAVHDKPQTGDAKLFQGGDPGKPGPVVRRGFLSFLNESEPTIESGQSGRLELAKWIASPDNPLTARVMVNRLWQSHFGKGLVANPSNFGRQSPPPSHPELLDYLANELFRSGWSLRHIHRLIVQSHTYHLSSVEHGSGQTVDESNQSLWHFPRQRMDMESFRDSILKVSRRLREGSNGRHPFKATNELKYTQGTPFFESFDHEHRSVYLMQGRLSRHPMMDLFDGADSNVSTPVRGESTVPLQSLFVLNGSFLREQSAAFADRILTSSEDFDQRVDFAFLTAYSRRSTPEERAHLQVFLDRYSQQSQSHGMDVSTASREAWNSVAKSILGSNEFVYID